MTELNNLKKNNLNHPNIKRLELDYDDNYIIINLEERVIDIDGHLKEYQIDDKQKKELNDMIWEYQDIDEYDYWPDKTNDHPPLKTKWRISFYDEFDNYYHKSGALSFPPDLMKLVDILKKLKGK